MESEYMVYFLMALLHVVLVVPTFSYVFFQRDIPENKRWRQLVFLTLVPVLGPTMVALVHWLDRRPVARPSDRYMGQSIDEHLRKFPGGWS